jgi:hypothetical protein
MPPPPLFTPIEFPPFNRTVVEGSIPPPPCIPNEMKGLDPLPSTILPPPEGNLSSPTAISRTSVDLLPQANIPPRIPFLGVPPLNTPQATTSGTSPVVPSSASVPNTAPLPTPPQETPKPDLPPDVRGFDDNIIRSLNKRLEDPDWMRRTDAANDYFIILSANPNLEKRPEYKPYVDAFALKILRDPSAVVHEAMLRAMQVGYYRYPSPEVLNELYRLRDSAGMLGLETQMVDDAIKGIEKAQREDAKEVQRQRPQPPQGFQQKS